MLDSLIRVIAAIRSDCQAFLKYQLQNRTQVCICGFDDSDVQLLPSVVAKLFFIELAIMPRPHIHQNSRRLRNDRFVCQSANRNKLMFDAPEGESQASPPSPDREFVDRLRDLLRESPETMSGYLEEIRRKLEDGSYLTREAAEESAQRMMDDGMA